MISARYEKAIKDFYHFLGKNLIFLTLLVTTACTVTIPGNTLPAPGNTAPPPTNTSRPPENTISPTETSEPAPSPTMVEPVTIDYQQIKIWNWGNPEIYLTYDPALWEATEGDSLESKTYPGCHIAGNGFRDGGPGGPPPYTYQSETLTVGGIEYYLDIEIPDATGIPDMFHVYWDEQNKTYKNAVALFPGPEGFDECVAGFWEVMQLSAANSFAP